MFGPGTAPGMYPKASQGSARRSHRNINVIPESGAPPCENKSGIGREALGYMLLGYMTQDFEPPHRGPLSHYLQLPRPHPYHLGCVVMRFARGHDCPQGNSWRFRIQVYHHPSATVSSDQNSSLQDFSHIARGAGSLGGALERLIATRPKKPQIDYMTMSVFCSPL